jgi:hypothetical protein
MISVGDRALFGASPAERLVLRVPELPVTAYLLDGNERSRRAVERTGLSRIWRGPDAGNPDATAIRLLYSDQPLASAWLRASVNGHAVTRGGRALGLGPSHPGPGQTVEVARVRGILDRLRPAGAPGAAARAGVPVDRRESLDRELAPAFAHLEPVLRECAQITREAADAARRREAEAASQANDIIAGARTASEAERAQAAAAAHTSAASETERILGEARAQALEVRRRGEQRRSPLVARVVDLVRADLRGLADDRGSGA